MLPWYSHITLLLISSLFNCIFNLCLKCLCEKKKLECLNVFYFGAIVRTELNSNWFRYIVKDKEAWHAVVHGVAKSQTRLSDWTTTILWLHIFPFPPPPVPDKHNSILCFYKFDIFMFHEQVRWFNFVSNLFCIYLISA